MAEIQAGDSTQQPLPPRRTFTCVCGFDVEISDADPPAACPRCGRPILPGSLTVAALSIGATVIGDLRDEDAESLPVHPGDHLDHFRVLELLGAGGMGAVFRGRDESLQRFVAIKVIRGGHASPVLRERIIQEARAQARVAHHHVVHIYYVGIHHECPFFAMELVQGQTLAELIRRRRLPFADIVRYGLQTADALRHSARLGVIHGDVKPSNILLDESGSPKLSDFGLAGLSNETAEQRSSTGPAGTLNYMAPEVAGGRAPDARSDMYSLGVMLYELTFGELPHAASSESLQENLKQRQAGIVRFPDVMPEDRPEEWNGFLRRALHRDPARRFANWDQLLRELRQWRCTNAPTAGRISRLLAWLLDMTFIMIGAAITGIVHVLPAVVRGQSAESGGGPLVFLVPLLLTMLHLRWGTSVGKRLLHLRITDAFGLRPSRRKILLKSFGTYLPVWIGAVNEMLDFAYSLASQPEALSLTILKGILAAAAVIWLLANGVWLLFSRTRQTLMDRLLGLRVTLAITPDESS